MVNWLHLGSTLTAALFLAALAPPSPASGQSGGGGHPPGEIHTREHVEGASLKDLSRQVNNPISTLWTLQNQFDITTVDDIPKGSGGQAGDRVKFN